jgi:hypothetical protein
MDISFCKEIIGEGKNIIDEQGEKCSVGNKPQDQNGDQR